jgi:ketosteroid isomerase-like protein
MTHEPFDFAAFRDAFEQRDVARWVDFYGDDAEWVELRHFDPPSSPNRMLGKQAIGDFLRHLSAIELELAFSNEVVGEDRAAFRVDTTFPDGKRIVEHVIIELEQGKIVRQVDVEAWD